MRFCFLYTIRWYPRPWAPTCRQVVRIETGYGPLVFHRDVGLN